MRWSRLALACGLCSLCLLGSSVLAQPRASLSPEEQRVRQLVEQLGAHEYATREKAQAELSQMGLLALEVLIDAQQHDDIEIAIRARQLVKSMPIRWDAKQDAPKVSRLMNRYGSRDLAERGQVIKQLADLPERMGLVALCRIARFEPSLMLSKRAALSVMRSELGDGPANVAAAKQIHEIIGASRRPATDWLRYYARFLGQPDDAAELWEELVDMEERTYAVFPKQSSADLTRELLQAYANFLTKLDKPAQAQAVAMRMIRFLADDQRNQILETVDWMLQNEWWDAVDAVYAKHASAFRQRPLLMYRLAESRKRAGNMEGALEAAEMAARDTAQSSNELHLTLAFSLQNEGMVYWAEFAYRQAITDPESSLELVSQAFVFLAEMLHDVEEDKRAAEVLREMFAKVGNDSKTRERIENDLGQPMASLEARMHYFRAKNFEQSGLPDNEAKAYQQAVQLDPRDSDILIGMFRRSERDPRNRNLVAKRIQEAVDSYQSDIQKLEAKLTDRQARSERSRTELDLAQACNQMAWLISNTQGDFEAALQASRRSLEIRSDSSGFRDTLARCYYAKGEFAQAVTEQQRAVELEPNSVQMKKQLELFQEALKQQQLKDGTAKDASGQ